MNDRPKSIETESNFKRARITALSNEQNDDSIDTEQSEEELVKYGKNAYVTRIIAKLEIQNFKRT